MQYSSLNGNINASNFLDEALLPVIQRNLSCGMGIEHCLLRKLQELLENTKLEPSLNLQYLRVRGNGRTEASGPLFQPWQAL